MKIKNKPLLRFIENKPGLSGKGFSLPSPNREYSSFEDKLEANLNNIELSNNLKKIKR